MDTFRVRLNCIDHYQAVPNDEFDPPVPLATASNNAKDRPRVSVLRVFGATETGQKVLMHIHGAFQYTYIEYSGSLMPDDVDVAIRTLQLSIDHALATSYRKDPYEGKHRYVAHITLVKGVPFYGYHVGYKFYLKIYLLNPLHMTRLADLLREGAVMKRVLQPYESHMQYIAQWMCDYNLYGCAYIVCEQVKFRHPVPSYVELTNSLHPWHDRSILPENISDEFAVPKQSHCTLEVDVCVHALVNRRSVEERSLHQDFIERTNPLSLDAKLVQSMAGLWKDETQRRKARMGLKNSNSSPFPPEVLVSMSADPRNTGEGGWIHEEEYREKVAQIAKDELENGDGSQKTFETFVKPVALESNVRTALESIDDLYPHRMQQLRQHVVKEEDLPAATQAQVVIDVNRVRSFAGDDFSGSEDGHPSEQTGQNGSLVRGVALEDPNAALAEKVLDTADGVPQTEYDGGSSSAKHLSRGVKRARFASPPKLKKKKRPKLVDANHVLPDLLGETTSDSETDSQFNDSGIDEGSQKGTIDPGKSAKRSELCMPPASNQQQGLDSARDVDSALPRSSQTGRLPFPVVKDPSDPNTILRLSQGSASSQKLSQSNSEQKTRSLANTKTPVKSAVSIETRTPTSAATVKSLFLTDSPNVAMNGLPRPRLGSSCLIYSSMPPTAATVKETMWREGLPDMIYQEAYYSNEIDVPEQAREYAGREFKLESSTVPWLPDFDPKGNSAATHGRKQPVLIDYAAEEVAENQRRKRCTFPKWSIADLPPRKKEVADYFEAFDVEVSTTAVSAVDRSRKSKLSQIDGPTQKNKHGFKYSQKQASTSVQHETQYMSIMSLEVHVNTRGSLAPNPEEDEIACVFWCVQTDDEDIEVNINKDGMHMGILAVANEPETGAKIDRSVDVEVEQEDTELDVLTRMVDIVRFYDPDILTGYEVHNSSWGYLIERARLKYDLNLCDELSRMKSQSHGRFGKDEDRWGFNHTSTIRVTGRHTINIWRAMRGELNLLQYTMENVALHLLHQRMPHYPFATLTKWYKSKRPRDRAKVVEYFTSRALVDLEILEANELVPRTSEQARLIGVDWFSVISRGSQFKVENIMFRIAKPENLILVSPSRRQVGGQNALECLPLVMEPQSDFYTSPLLVLDFQSLYPSVMIAYNYCYSTFLGRVVSWRGTNKMGFSDYRRTPGLVDLLKEHINIAPNGIMYAKSEIRKSLLAKMLSEIVETRVMVKSGMKIDKDDKILQRLLNNRQLALKLIANVTYGYTSASFSGRMPCSEIADSIVQTGRETLEKAIALIHSVERWGAEVVYGDTDSLFVYLKGRTRAQAFDIGEEIADTITKMNPRPVKLKFEKVYHPCVLLAKKRYVGFKYESRTQTEPEFDAKGIETVRRDGTPAEQKIEENALKVLFRTADLSQVKSYFQAQCARIMRGSVSIQDFCFAKEVKLGTYSEKGPPPPGALISARRMLEDPRLEPQYGERVPYVVVTGGPGARLIDRCVAPDVLLDDAQQELDSEYYISKNIIPPLERIFNLVGANVRGWFDEMPKYQRIRRVDGGGVDGEGREVVGQGMLKKTLESYMKSSTCVVCREGLDGEGAVCSGCVEQGAVSLLSLRARLVKAERRVKGLNDVCRSCSGLVAGEEVRCDSKDCPVFYSRVREKARERNERALIEPVVRALEEREADQIAW